MSKLIKFTTESREALKRGIDILAQAVKVTLGPKGRNVIIGKELGTPHITKDGVTVAKSIELEDPFENVGAQLVKEVANKTCDASGDGTTTSTVLAQSIITTGLKYVTSGATPIDLKKGIDKAVATVVNSIKSQSVIIGDDFSKIENVAKISANNDEEIGKLIAEAFKLVKKDGIITVEEAKGTETTMSVVEGMQFDRGYISPYFINDTTKASCNLENPLILICGKKITNLQELLPVLEKVAKTGSPLLIIAEDIDSAVLATLVLNVMRGSLKLCAVKAPSFGDYRKEMLQDIAALTGGIVISDETGLKLEDVSFEVLGHADSVTVTKEFTTITGGCGDHDRLAQRVQLIKSQMETVTAGPDLEKLQSRLAKLIGGVAVISVGAASEVEMKEKKDRIDDALCATRAAVEEGIVPGGGVTYIRAISELETLKGSTEDEQLGIEIVKRAIEEPMRQIVANAGKEGAVIVQKVKEGKGDFGYNARTDTYENLLSTGVIDPAKVTRTALENAASVAGLFLTTECVIVDNPEKLRIN